jgi:hypothetical protein
VLQRLGRLDWSAGLGGDVKRAIHARLGGNHRAIEWVARLLADRAAEPDELLAALAAQQAPPDTPEAAVEVVLQGMRQNLLFGELRARIVLAQGDPQPALEYWQEALALAQETGNAEGLFHVAGAMGRVLAQAGQQEPARELPGLAIQVGRSAGLPGVERLEQALGKLG